MFPTKNNTPPEARQLSIDSLNSVLATLTDLHSQLKTAHWNVKGAMFWQLHLLFDQIASTVFEAIDPVAERITALGGTANGTIAMTAAATQLVDFKVDATEAEYLHQLATAIADTANMIRCVSEILNKSDAVTANHLMDLTFTLDQQLFFVESFLQK
jgi:starvation-inducible DNA-binding protein